MSYRCFKCKHSACEYVRANVQMFCLPPRPGCDPRMARTGGDFRCVCVQPVTPVLYAAVRQDNHGYQPLNEIPCRAVFFPRQSHVTAHAELMWLLTCSTPVNWLDRMIQFKEKKVKQVPTGRKDPPPTSRLVLLTKTLALFRYLTVDKTHLPPHISVCSNEGLLHFDILRGTSLKSRRHCSRWLMCTT